MGKGDGSDKDKCRESERRLERLHANIAEVRDWISRKVQEMRNDVTAAEERSVRRWLGSLVAENDNPDQAIDREEAVQHVIAARNRATQAERKLKVLEEKISKLLNDDGPYAAPVKIGKAVLVDYDPNVEAQFSNKNFAPGAVIVDGQLYADPNSAMRRQGGQSVQTLMAQPDDIYATTAYYEDNAPEEQEVYAKPVRAGGGGGGGGAGGGARSGAGGSSSAGGGGKSGGDAGFGGDQLEFYEDDDAEDMFVNVSAQEAADEDDEEEDTDVLDKALDPKEKQREEMKKKNKLKIKVGKAEERDEAGRRTVKRERLELNGYLTMQGQKNKRSWKRLFFVLHGRVLLYYKSAEDIEAKEAPKPLGRINVSNFSKIARVKNDQKGHCFEIRTPTEAFVFSGDSKEQRNEWVKVLNLVQKSTAERSRPEDNGTAMRGWMTKVKRGRLAHRYFVLVGRVLYYHRRETDLIPSGELFLLDARVEDVDQLEYSDKEEDIGDYHVFGLRTRHSLYHLVAPTSEEKDKWMFFIVGASNSSQLLLRTDTERIIAALRDNGNRIRDPILKSMTVSYDPDPINESLTTLPTKEMETVALDVWRWITEYMSTPINLDAPEGHIELVRKIIQANIDMVGLHNETYCQLIKQTNSTGSMFASNAPHIVVQGWQLLTVCIGCFLPTRNILSYLKLHLERNGDSDVQENVGVQKEAAYSLKALKRTLAMRGRKKTPSKMEILAHMKGRHTEYAYAMTVVIYLMNGASVEVGFDASSTCAELAQRVCKELNMRNINQNGFALYREGRSLKGKLKLSDLVREWEQVEPDIHNNLALTFKRRLFFKNKNRVDDDNMTDLERKMLYYQGKDDIVMGRFPVNEGLSVELTSLQAQIEHGDYVSAISGKGKQIVGDVLRKALPVDMVSGDRFGKILAKLEEKIVKRWTSLHGSQRSKCIQQYLNNISSWPYYGATLFKAQRWTGEGKKRDLSSPFWMAVHEKGIHELSMSTMTSTEEHPYSRVLSFGVTPTGFMMVVRVKDEKTKLTVTEKRFLQLDSDQECTSLVASYINDLMLNEHVEKMHS